MADVVQDEVVGGDAAARASHSGGTTLWDTPLTKRMKNGFVTWFGNVLGVLDYP